MIKRLYNVEEWQATALEQESACTHIPMSQIVRLALTGWFSGGLPCQVIIASGVISHMGSLVISGYIRIGGNG